MTTNSNSDTDVDDLIQEIKGRMILHWNYRQLDRIPEALRFCASDIREIYLKENKLTNLPNWINELKNLTHLYLCGNTLRKVPSELVTVSHLALLDLSDNGLTLLPDSIGDLGCLEILTVDNNRLKKLPYELSRLKNLESLSICDNEFSVLPEWLGSLEKLEQLRADNNRLKELPNRLTLLSRLRIISVCSNRLSYMPLGGFVSRPSIYFISNPSLNYLSYLLFDQLLVTTGDVDISSGRTSFENVGNSSGTNLELCFTGHRDTKVTIVLPRQLLKIHSPDANLPVTLWELSLRRMYCKREQTMRKEPQDRMSPRVAYNLLVNGPIAICTNDKCREAIFTEAWLIASTFQQQDSVSFGASIVALYCCQNCSRNFDSLHDLKSLQWQLVHQR